MNWNWEHPDWPEFRYEPQALASMEATFLQKAGEISGVFLHVPEEEQQRIRIEFMSEEALRSSLIEGERLNRESVQVSIQRNFGLSVAGQPKPLPREQGIADLLGHAYSTFAEPLTQDLLFHWHRLLLGGTLWADEVGCYRDDAEGMQVVSGATQAPNLHYQAPPAVKVPEEMGRFCQFFEQTKPNPTHLPLPALTRAGLAHLHFLAIHPFTDGNGRLARVISQKTLWQAVGRPYLASLSHIIEAGRKRYYSALESTNRTLEVTNWLLYFAETVLASLDYSQQCLDFLLQKSRFFDQYSPHLNPRQSKVLQRIFREGSKGFQGGLSASNYQSITQTSPATARRDLTYLVNIGALVRTGERKGTRYLLKLR